MPEVHEIHTTLPGLVVRHLVADGERVSAGQGILVTETMKCEQTLLAPADGTVSFACTLGDVVEPGHTVARVTPVRASKPAPVRTRPPRPLSPQAVVDLVCGPDSDPRLGRTARSGTFVEYDLFETPPMFANPSPGDRLVRVETGHERECGVMIGVMTHVVDGHPDGISRVWIGGDPSRSMGAVAEAECRRILAAIDLAERLDVPLEWVAISAGARIAWDSGTENMDWCAAVVARLITFTQRGGQVVVVVSGINVGAQSYWNAEATMLGHHKGMLIMLPDQAMVLTGKRALALSGGGTHATDAHIGGYDEVMGPNGQAHHKAATMIDAYRMVFSHHSLCSLRRDERAPVVASSDPLDRDITVDRYTESEPFATIGEVLGKTTHPSRKQAFAMRLVMGSVVDRDAPVLERWTDMADARGTIVWDSRIGGSPVSVIGIEARPVKSDTGDHWLSASTLHPEGSRKVAKAINAASGNRPVVVLASLSGFDGSARSMKGRQLEFGAEIARAVTNFEGPLVVVVLGRFHGGAYVVFSKALNPNVRILALDGAFVSVIGGDAAAGVVFAGELKKREAAAMAEDPTQDPVAVHRRERAALARKFDEVHDVHRAAEVGSIDEVIDVHQIRSAIARLIDAGVPDAPALMGGWVAARQVAPAGPMPDTAITTGVDTGWNSGVGAVVEER
jgi:acetyl-CoA carboxylase carboxyltransferase component